jgi:hypothetical protein
LISLNDEYRFAPTVTTGIVLGRIGTFSHSTGACLAVELERPEILRGFGIPISVNLTHRLRQKLGARGLCDLIRLAVELTRAKP